MSYNNDYNNGYNNGYNNYNNQYNYQDNNQYNYQYNNQYQYNNAGYDYNKTTATMPAMAHPQRSFPARCTI